MWFSKKKLKTDFFAKQNKISSKSHHLGSSKSFYRLFQIIVEFVLC